MELQAHSRSLHECAVSFLALIVVNLLVATTPTHAASSPRAPVKTVHTELPVTVPTPAATSRLPLNTALGTASSPLVIRPLRQPDDPEERAEQKAHRAWEARNAYVTLVLATIMALIASIQVVLFRAQLRMMRQNIQDTAAAAKAAELNAKAAIGIELPHIRAVPTDLLATHEPVVGEAPYGGVISDAPPGLHNALSAIELSNHGRTPAFSLAVSVGWMVARELPHQVPAYQRKIRLNHNVILGPGGEMNFPCDIGIELSEEETRDVARDTKWLWVFGEVEFRDFMDQIQTTRFCWRHANRNAPGDPKFYYLASDGEPPAAYTRRKYNINID